MVTYQQIKDHKPCSCSQPQALTLHDRVLAMTVGLDLTLLGLTFVSSYFMFRASESETKRDSQLVFFALNGFTNMYMFNLMTAPAR